MVSIHSVRMLATREELVQKANVHQRRLKESVIDRRIAKPILGRHGVVATAELGRFVDEHLSFVADVDTRPSVEVTRGREGHGAQVWSSGRTRPSRPAVPGGGRDPGACPRHRLRGVCTAG